MKIINYKKNLFYYSLFLIFGFLSLYNLNNLINISFKNNQYSLIIKTESEINNKLTINPAIYFNQDYTLPITGILKKNMIVFNKIPSEIRTFRISLMFPKNQIYKINKIFIEKVCLEDKKKCGKIFDFEFIKNFSNWHIDGVLVEDGLTIKSIDTENIFIWGDKVLDLTKLSFNKNSLNSDFFTKGFYVTSIYAIFSTAFLILFFLNLRNNSINHKFAVIATCSIVSFFILIFSSLPGHSNFDEYASISEFYKGELTDTHPPMQTLLWASLISIFETLGFNELIQVSSLLIVTISIFLITLIILSIQIKSLFLIIFLFLIFIISPFFLIYLPHIGKDTIMTVSLFSSCIGIYLFLKNNTKTMFLFVMLFLVICYGSRSNAPAAIIPLVFYFSYVWAKNLIKERKYKIIEFIDKKAILVPLISLSMIAFLFISNKLINLSFVKNFGDSYKAFLMTPIHDLKGMSVYGNKILIPKNILRTNNLEEIKKTYIPWNLDFSLIDSSQYDFKKIINAWYKTIIQYPELYIQHRVNILSQFFGFKSGQNPLAYSAGFFYAPNDLRINQNKEVIEKFSSKYTLYHSLSLFQKGVRLYVSNFKSSIFFKPWFYICLACASLFFTFRHKNEFKHLTNMLFISSFFYLAPYILLVNSASIRYALWPIFCSVLILALRLDGIRFLNFLNLKEDR